MLLGLAAALVPSREPVEPTISLLAPCGRVDAVPTRVCWRATLAISRVRLRLRDAGGKLVSARTESVRPEVRSIALLPSEQARLAAAGEATIELVAMGPDGEWRGQSLPGRLSLPRRATLIEDGTARTPDRGEEGD